MRILDTISDHPITNICLYLTPSEAQEMIDSLDQLLKEPQTQHNHLYDQEYVREIIVTVYTRDNMREFDERSRRLINDGS